MREDTEEVRPPGEVEIISLDDGDVELVARGTDTESLVGLLKRAAAGYAPSPNASMPEITFQRAPGGEVRAVMRCHIGGEEGTASGLSQFNENYTFENFVIGPSNRLAHAAALAVADQPGKTYNPLFIHAAVGLGKSHLLQGICLRMLRMDPTARIRYTSCEDFANDYVASVQKGQASSFRDKFRHLTVLVVDDIHFLGNRETTQEEFFHTFNALYNAGGQIILSSDSSPNEIPELEERLVSRFQCGLVAEIEAPGFETRLQIINQKAKMHGFQIPLEVAETLAASNSKNIRELEGLVSKLVAYASLVGRPVSKELAIEIVSSRNPAQDRMLSIADITQAVSEKFGIPVEDMRSQNRSRRLLLPRHLAVYLARTLTTSSLNDIGNYFGNRDHSTIKHSVDKIEQDMQSDRDFRATVSRLKSSITTASSTQRGNRML